MDIKSLVEQNIIKSATSVPHWMIGGFKRRSISFSNGLTDLDTHVFWLQSRNLTIDLRLPIKTQQTTPKPFEQCTAEELYKLCNYEGWSADSIWQNDRLSWVGGTSFQIHNRWPEPAELKRVGDCMVEFAPSGAYVEDWRLLSRCSGTLVGLELIDETNLSTGNVNHRGGALIINGDWAGLVMGRPHEIDSSRYNASDVSDSDIQLRSLLKSINTADPAQKNLLNSIFQFETSIAQGSIEDGFQVIYSSNPNRLGEPLFDLEGFELDKRSGTVTHRFNHSEGEVERVFRVDCLEPSFNYSPVTPQTRQAEEWFHKEAETLSRYLKKVDI